MSPTVEGAGVELAYQERGEGPGIVLVHGMASSARAMMTLADVFAREARVIAYDRRGYGDSGAPEPYERTTVNEQAEDLAAVIRALGLAPAVALGEDVGALAIIDVLLRHRGLIHKAVLIDPPLYAFVPEATEPLAAERLALETAIRDGGPAHAVEQWLLSRWPDDPDDFPPKSSGVALARAREASTAFFADYGSIATLPLTRADIRSIDLPLAVVDSPRAPWHQHAASDALVRLAPGATGLDIAPALRWMVER
jgi:pimeloyl-ACP methyl ester carboxylesterase